MSNDSDSSFDEAPLSPATSTRLSWDEQHYREREHEFMAPIKITPVEHGGHEIAFQLARSTTHTIKTIQELTAEDCLRYRFKDCVVL